MHSRRSLLVIAALLPALMAGCAAFPGMTPMKVNVVGLESLPGEGFELRFAVKLRVQNPNSVGFDFDGIALDLDVNGRALASGVSNARGTVPRFGETVVTVPVSVSAVATVRQMLGLMNGGGVKGELPYALRGRLGGGVIGSLSFASEGTLKLPQ